MIKSKQLRCATASLALLAGALSSRGADYPTTVNSFSPVGYWRFNETATSPPLNKAVNASTLGNALDGAVILDVEKGQPGIVGLAARFNNSAVDAGYCGSKIDIPFNPALNKKGAFSVECWVKPASLGTDAT